MRLMEEYKTKRQYPCKKWKLASYFNPCTCHMSMLKIQNFVYTLQQFIKNARSTRKMSMQLNTITL